MCSKKSLNLCQSVYHYCHKDRTDSSGPKRCR